MLRKNKINPYYAFIYNRDKTWLIKEHGNKKR